MIDTLAQVHYAGFPPSDSLLLCHTSISNKCLIFTIGWLCTIQSSIPLNFPAMYRAAVLVHYQNRLTYMFIKILTFPYGMWNLDFFCQSSDGICLRSNIILVALDFLPICYHFPDLHLYNYI